MLLEGLSVLAGISVVFLLLAAFNRFFGGVDVRSWKTRIGIDSVGGAGSAAWRLWLG